MDKMTRFSNNLRKLLIDKVSNHELDLPVEKIKRTLLTFGKVVDELRYFIDNDIVNKLTKDDIKEIESLWNSFYKK
ncbi:MAG: hypothetical protein ABR927_14640 [Bacteroidales bacterium]|jgi:hypothetical protein